MYIGLIITVSFVQKVFASNRVFTYGLINGHSAEYDGMNLAANNDYNLNNVSIILKRFNISENINLFTQASLLLQQNVVALIEGSHTKTSACALSTVTGIPLICLHGDSRPFDLQCENAIQMSAGYRDYAHATLDILNTFGWENVVLIFDDSFLYEAGYFQVISRTPNVNHTVNLVRFFEQDENEDPTASVFRAIEEIDNIEADVLLLYTKTEITELMLKLLHAQICVLEERCKYNLVKLTFILVHSRQKPCQHKHVYKWIIQGQVPLYLNGLRNDVVLALKIPYIQSSAPDELEKAVGLSNYSKTIKDLKALAYDAVQVVNQAVNIKPCLSMNGTSVGLKDTSEMLTCMRKSYRPVTFIFVHILFIDRYVANQQPCDLTVVPGLSTDKGLSFALQDNDPHAKDFKLAILRLHENHFLDNLRREWWETKNECPQEHETTLSRERIGLMSMLGVYVVMGVGIVVACLTLIAEIFWKRRQQKIISKVGVRRFVNRVDFNIVNI
ncbi:Glutamate receptor ionotropic, delta-1 [Desmophyllum pertusum]|uniref:Glutamate receptor ionotropic, delta-1 n=1 Tax=Desmophyllum pertusum TaxID=174260 RepID=A0A9W9YEU6_9CNID|nr:Glutamate receptor ionotropic, delta-1 [Desmophyllum pertusum]